MKEQKIIMYASDQAATYKTNLSGWVTGDGFYYGKDENIARYAGCTHKICECGEIVSKSYVRCEKCRHKQSRERYLKLPFKEWDGKEPVCDRDGDTYFFDIDTLNDYMYEHELEVIDLLFCGEIGYREIRIDDIADDVHEDWEPSEELCEKVEALNKYLRSLPCHSYTPGKIRTTYELP